MKILLISPNVEHLPDPVFPLGAAYIAAALEQAGLDCHCLDLCFSDDPLTLTAETLEWLQPELVGLSLRNVDNVSYPCSVSYLPFYQALMKTIRLHSRAPVVLGGSGFTLLPDELLRFLSADYGIAGEGEVALLRLIRHLNGEVLLEKDDLPIIRPGRGPVAVLDPLPFPARGKFDGARYLRSGGMGNLQTKRGCPFGCIYCTYPLIEGRTVRMRSPDSVCAEIQILKSQGIDTLFITDNEFNFPMEHALAVCREIVRRKIQIKWSAYANPAFISTELLEAMQAAGCTGVEFGTDAACAPMLANMGKCFDVGQIQTASRLCRKVGMGLLPFPVAGWSGRNPSNPSTNARCRRRPESHRRHLHGGHPHLSGHAAGRHRPGRRPARCRSRISETGLLFGGKHQRFHPAVSAPIFGSAPHLDLPRSADQHECRSAIQTAPFRRSGAFVGVYAPIESPRPKLLTASSLTKNGTPLHGGFIAAPESRSSSLPFELTMII